MKPKDLGQPAMLVAIMLCGMAWIVTAFITIFRATERAGQVRGVGMFLIAFGCTFFAAILWQVVSGRGVPLSTSVFGKFESVECERERTPKAYWAILVVMMILSLALVSGGIFLRLHSDRAAKALPYQASKERF